MYKSTSRSEQFREKTGDQSDRISPRGYGESNDTWEVLSSLKEQYEALRERLKTENDTSIRADLIRQISDMKITMNEGSRFSFERIFCKVVAARLPPDVFKMFVEEARTYWRQEGWSDLMPPPSNRVLKKNFKRQVKERVKESERRAQEWGKP